MVSARATGLERDSSSSNFEVVVVGRRTFEEKRTRFITRCVIVCLNTPARTLSDRGTPDAAAMTRRAKSEKGVAKCLYYDA